MSSSESNSDESGDEDSEEEDGNAVNEDDYDVTTDAEEDNGGNLCTTEATTLSSESDGEAERCPICLAKIFDQDVASPESCDHVFCYECLLEWSKNVNTCPVDRQVFNLILAKHSPDGGVFEMRPVENVNRQVSETDTTVCEICGHGDREDRLLLCDGCDNGYHMDCLEPPLDHLPVGDWNCQECVARSQGMPDLSCSVAKASSSAKCFATTDQPRHRANHRQRTSPEHDLRQPQKPHSFRGNPGRNWRDHDSNSEEEEIAPSTSATLNRRRVTGARKTTRRRKTGARKSGKRKSTKRGAKKSRKRRKVRRKKTKVRTVAYRIATPKERIARNLGLSNPPAGRNIPLVKEPSAEVFREKPAELSILGSVFDLEPLDASPAKRQQKEVENTDEPIPQAESSDVIANILLGQERLALGSHDLVINRDGSIKVRGDKVRRKPQDGEGQTSGSGGNQDSNSGSSNSASGAGSNPPTSGCDQNGGGCGGAGGSGDGDGDKHGDKEEPAAKADVTADEDAEKEGEEAAEETAAAANAYDPFEPTTNTASEDEKSGETPVRDEHVNGLYSPTAELGEDESRDVTVSPVKDVVRESSAEDAKQSHIKKLKAARNEAEKDFVLPPLEEDIPLMKDKPKRKRVIQLEPVVLDDDDDDEANDDSGEDVLVIAVDEGKKSRSSSRKGRDNSRGSSEERDRRHGRHKHRRHSDERRRHSTDDDRRGGRRERDDAERRRHRDDDGRRERRYGDDRKRDFSGERSRRRFDDSDRTRRRDRDDDAERRSRRRSSRSRDRRRNSESLERSAPTKHRSRSRSPRRRHSRDTRREESPSRRRSHRRSPSPRNRRRSSPRDSEVSRHDSKNSRHDDKASSHPSENGDAEDKHGGGGGKRKKRRKRSPKQEVYDAEKGRWVEVPRQRRRKRSKAAPEVASATDLRVSCTLGAVLEETKRKRKADEVADKRIVKVTKGKDSDADEADDEQRSVNTSRRDDPPTPLEDEPVTSPEQDQSKVESRGSSAHRSSPHTPPREHQSPASSAPSPPVDAKSPNGDADYDPFSPTDDMQISPENSPPRPIETANARTNHSAKPDPHVPKAVANQPGLLGAAPVRLAHAPTMPLPQMAGLARPPIVPFGLEGQLLVQAPNMAAGGLPVAMPPPPLLAAVSTQPPAATSRRVGVDLGVPPAPLPAKAIQEMEQISKLLNLNSSKPPPGRLAAQQTQPFQPSKSRASPPISEAVSPVDDDVSATFTPPPPKDRKRKKQSKEKNKGGKDRANDKYIEKLHRQERVVEEVKMALKPHYGSKKISKEEYKDVLRKAVPKVCNSKTKGINPSKIKTLVDGYVDKILKMRKYVAKKAKQTSGHNF